MKRKSKKITKKEDLELLLNITDKDFTKTFMMKCFGDFGEGPKFNPYDLIDIPPGKYGSANRKNKNTFTTTVGLWVYNKFFIEKNFFNSFGYISDTLTKKNYGKIKQQLVFDLMEDRITVDQFKEFLTYTEFLMPYVTILAPNDTNEILTISTKIEPKKQKLIKENEEAIKNGDALTATYIEKELLDLAVNELKDDPSLDSYVSGARGSLGNNFKNVYVMKGPIRDPITNEFNIATSNYNDGISPEEYAIFANSLAAGPFSRTDRTKIGGYWEKLFVAAFQHIQILPPGSDCHTKRHIEITLDNPELYLYSYIIEKDNKLVMLTSQNMNKYKGKKVKLRFSSMCESKDGICSVCAGAMFEKLGMTNVGLALALIPSKLKNIAMKAFHDSTSKFSDMNVEEAFGFDGKTRKKV